MTKPAETGWLIEHPLDPRYGRESWYCGKDGFTLDSLLAIRYSRKEDARRLARYDEMFSLLKEAANDGWFSNKDLHDRLQTFLAAEGKVAG